MLGTLVLICPTSSPISQWTVIVKQKNKINQTKLKLFTISCACSGANVRYCLRTRIEPTVTDKVFEINYSQFLNNVRKFLLEFNIKEKKGNCRLCKVVFFMYILRVYKKYIY